MGFRINVMWFMAMIGIENRSRDAACKAWIPETKCLEDCKMNKTVSYLLFLGICVSLAGSAFGMIPIPVGNADFEEPAVPVGDYTYTMTPWEFIPTPWGAYDPWVTHGYYGGEPTPLTQSVYCEAQIVYQKLSATYLGGCVYVFSVDVGDNSGDGYDGDDWEIFFFDATTGDAETPLVSVSSTDPGQAPIPVYGQWFRKSVTFVPTVEQVGHSIGIGFTGEQYAMFDNVTVEYERGAPAALVAPIDWAHVDLAKLEWLRPTPLVAGDTILCNVYFGSVDPNLIPGVYDSLQIESGQDIDETGAFAGHPLVLNKTYYWRVDCIDPNGGNGDIITKGNTWSFTTTIPPAVIVTASGDSTEVGEEDRLANRDDYILSLTMDPGAGVSVSVTVSEVLSVLAPTTTVETMEAYNGEAANAPELQVTHSGGTVALSRISAGGDDVEEAVSDGGIYGNSGDLEFFFGDGSGQIIGLRFQNVAIEQGATIDSAIVEFEVDETNATGEVHGIITGEDVDNAPALAAEDFHLTNRLAANPTTATSSFAWTEDYAVNDKVPTPDISSIIQQIVDRVGWVSGNSIVLFFTEDMNLDEPDIEFIDATDPWALRSSTYVLDSSNWEGVPVTIAAIDDSLIEADPELVTLAATASSADSAWTGLPVADVVVTILENDCGAWGFVPIDINKDCVIDLGDLAEFASQFGTCTDPRFPAICDDDR